MNTRLKSKSYVSLEEAGRVNLKRMLRLRLPLIAGIFAALAIPGGVAVWKLFPPTYKASADVRFLASTPRVMDRDSRESMVPYEKFLNTQVSLMTGNAVFSKVLEEPDVRSLPMVASSAAPLDFLKEAVRAEAQPNSELVTISCKLPERDTAKRLVEAVLDAYLQYALSEEADTGGERLRALVKERDRRQEDLDSQLRKISELQQQLEMPAAATGRGGAERTSAYQEPHARAEEDVSRSLGKAGLLTDQIAQAGELYTRHKAAPGKPIFDMGVEDRVATDPRVIAARQEFAKCDAVYAEIANRYGEKSPQFEVERDKVSALRARVAQTELTARGEVIASMRALLERELGAAQAEVKNAQARKAGFEGLIEEERRRSMEAAKTLAVIDELKIHAEETRTLLRAVREEITSIMMESNAPARVKLAAPPSVPPMPGMGRRLQVLALMMMMCAAAGLGAGYLRELTDQQIRSAEDLASIAGSPVLAMIPYAGGEVSALPEYGGAAGESRALVVRARGRGVEWQHKATAVAERPDTAVGNEFRKVLSSLTAARGCANAEGAVDTCMVTSPTAGDGKTLVACNLAIALTQADRRVLIIEMSPGDDLEDALGMEPGYGLTDVLFRGLPLLGAVRTTPFPGLHVLGAGSDPERLTMKTASREMAALIQEAGHGFDHVIIDVPPVLAMADAALLASVVDGVVLVTGAGVSKLEMVRQATMELHRAGANLLGIVLNCTRTSSAPPMPGIRRYEDYFSKRRGTPPRPAARTA